MKSTPLRTAALLAVGVLFLFGRANAEIIAQQPLHTNDLGVGAGVTSFAPIATSTNPSGMGLSGLLDTIRLWVRYGGTGSYFATINCFTNQSLSTPCGEWASATSSPVVVSSTPDAGLEYIYSSWAVNGVSPVELNANRFYTIVVSGAPFVNYQGIPSPNQCISATCVGIPYYYITTVDGDFPEDFTNSYVIQENSPLQAEVTESTTVTFDFDYWNTGFEGFNKAGIALSNLTAGQTVIVPEQNITQTGESTFTTQMSLIEGNAYMYRAYLRNASTSARVQGQTIIFHVVENQGGQSLIPDLNDENATSSVTNMLGGVFRVFELFEGRFPFNWFGETITILSTLNDDPTDQSELVLDFSSTPPEIDQLLGGEPLELFSEDTVSYFMPSGFLTALKFFITSVLYIGLVSNIFFTVKRRYA